jgi:hypothetical protein
MDNFQLSETDAQLKIADLLNSLQMVQTLNKRRKLKIKNNPGFLTKITQDPFKQNIMIEMDNINDIFYMNVIPIYIDSLIRITQSPETSNVDVSTIDGLCKTKQVEDIEQINEIIAPSEKGFTENVPVAIIAENLAFGETTATVKDKSINVLDFLYDDDDDLDDIEDDDDGIEVELDYEEEAQPSVNKVTKTVNVTKSVDEGIDVELDEGIDVELDEGIDVDLDEGIDVELDDNLEGGTNSKETTGNEPVLVLDNPDTVVKKIKKPIKLTIKGDEKLEKNITGMKIADPNPFFTAMYKKDPALFLTESDGKFSAYSRTCPWNKRRQPVILTDEEKELIDKEHPGSYNGHAIKYGSDPAKQYWYICPRYWDLKNNVSLTIDEVKSGDYGGIIPQGDKTVPAGKNIWEFTDPVYHMDNCGNYIHLSPGFLKKDVHPTGLRVPCCFKIWKDPKTAVEQKQEVDDYIKGPDRFPLEENRFGYLPFIVQKFIDTDNKKCQVSAINKNLKKNQPCYLRKGTENSKNKSFIASIADIYSEKNNDKILKIDDFINEKLVPMLTADTFITLQNGSLINEFQSKLIDNVDIEQIKDSTVYSKLKSSNPIQLQKITSALFNFIDYLKSPSSNVDYTYLWDLICEPNERLFTSGINLVILNVPSDDNTSNINIMCPTNYYSLSKYDPTKETAIIMQKYEYFEPIYIVIDQSKSNIMRIVTTKLYTPDLMAKIPNMKQMANTIQDIYSTMCKPLSSLPKAYKYKEIKFKRNITLERSVEILNKYDFTIQSLVVNYDDKVIGLNVEKRKQSGFIPCFPSGIISSYELVDIENEGQHKNMEETIQFLKMVTDETKGEILCKPIVKILEDKLIVGLLTETNQFIPLIEPEQDTDQSIKYSVDDENFIQVDKITQTSKKIDKTREEFVKKIKLETELYNAFRNKLRTMLNNYINKNVRDEIEMVANSVQMVYILQLERLVILIKKLLRNDVNFIPVTSENIKHIENNLKAGDMLLIPKNNLLSNLDNEDIYFSKIADELIRYNRIKQFMFKPKMFLSFTDLKYDLNMDEIILLQSLMTHDYFDDLVPAVTSNYISFNTYDTTEPSITQKYDNEYLIPIEKERPSVATERPSVATERPSVATEQPSVAKEQPRVAKEQPRVAKEQPRVEKIDEYIKRAPAEKRPFKIYNNCPVAIKEIFSKLKMKFRGGYKDVNFSFNTPNCTFDVALTMINNSISTPIDIIGIKQQLIQKYQELFSSYPREIVNMFDYYGYMTESKELASGRLSIENMIMNFH